MNGTILLVDDNRMFIEIEKEFLEYSHVDVLTAQDGLEALHVIKTNRPDLVFMDLQMPKMDGAACCRAIRSDPALVTIPVVMVTSKGKDEDRENCFSAGCDYFLTKPLDRDHFLEAARRYLPGVDRREKRLSINIDAICSINDKAFSCVLHDISMGGAFIATDYFGVPESVIRISFTLPDGTIIECPGRIAWVNRISSNLPKGFGVKFALMSKHAKESLERFIESVH
jgi:CheY-like chemotaxis protein